MATIHDVMPAFELFQPTSVDDTLSLLERHRRSVWVLAGGLDSFDWLKDRNKRPQVVVDLSGVQELRGIKALPDGGLEIGATTTLTEVVHHPVVKEKFGCWPTRPGSSRLRRFATRARSAATSRRTRAAGTTAAAGPAIARAATSATRIRRRRSIASTRIFDAEPLRRRQSVRHRAGARRARRPDGDPQLGRRACRGRRGVLHRTGDRHHADDRPEARRSADRDPHSRRRGPARSSTSRRCATGRCGTSRSSTSRRRMKMSGGTIEQARLVVNARGRASDAADGRRGRGRRQAAQRGDRHDGRRPGGPGRSAAGAQRLQDSVDEKPGEARDPGGGDIMNCSFRTGVNPWSEDILTHAQWTLLYAAIGFGVLFMLAHTVYVAFWPKPAGRRTRQQDWRRECRSASRDTRLAARMFHWIMAASMLTLLVTSFAADPRVEVRLGAHPLDGRHRPDDLDRLSHHPRDLLAGLLVDLAERGRSGRSDDAVQARHRRQRARAAQVGEVSVGQQDVSHGHRACRRWQWCRPVSS